MPENLFPAKNFGFGENAADTNISGSSNTAHAHAHTRICNITLEGTHALIRAHTHSCPHTLTLTYTNAHIH